MSFVTQPLTLVAKVWQDKPIIMYAELLEHVLYKAKKDRISLMIERKTHQHERD